MDTRSAFQVCLATIHEESHCEDHDYHHHHEFHYGRQRH
jgi:hypothetical protein